MSVIFYFILAWVQAWFAARCLKNERYKLAVLAIALAVFSISAGLREFAFLLREITKLSEV